MREYVRINKNDNVAVALCDLEKGREIAFEDLTVTLCEDVAGGHKFAIQEIKEAEPVIKYGYPIGFATGDIKVGAHVHVHNIKTGLGDDVSYTYNPVATGTQPEGKNPATVVPSSADSHPSTFNGYVRKNGRVGIRNELFVIPTVGCVNSIAKAIADAGQKAQYKGVDAVVAFTHPYGCSQMGDDQENSREALASLINHPNAGGVLVLGLGCENSNIGILKEYIGEYDPERVRFLQCQDVEDEVEEGIRIMDELAACMADDKRTPADVSKLIVGLKCGGSDGLSGITANPVVGVFSDMLTAMGGSTILTEVPEMFGAETILMDRAVDQTVFEKIVKMINDFKNYYRFHNQTIYENPSPGNKKGGISTLEDKALGCTQKSGSSQVTDVLDYAKRLEKSGLNLLYAPGNDLVASTALALSGAQIVLFTTGRGTPFATVVPTVKISTNTPLYEKKKQWIDFDCGRLLEESVTLENLAADLYNYVISIANGGLVKSEQDGYRDLAIFKQGVTL